jgi:hypothetical protein
MGAEEIVRELTGAELDLEAAVERSREPLRA